MNRFFVYPVELIYITKNNSEYSPHVALAVVSGFLLTGYVIKKYILKLIRKNV